MGAYLNTHFLIAFNALFIALLIGGAGWYSAELRSSLEYRIKEHIESTRAHMGELAILTDSNNADELTERIIADCPRRSDFESLLPNLAKLGPRELLQTQQLFESCGPFYSERKALMVAQLEREYNALEQDLEYLHALRDLTPNESAYKQWAELISRERERSAFLNEQTELQRGIIQLLIEGASREKLAELTLRAQSVAESLVVTDVQIDAIRGELVP